MDELKVAPETVPAEITFAEFVADEKLPAALAQFMAHLNALSPNAVATRNAFAALLAETLTARL